MYQEYSVGSDEAAGAKSRQRCEQLHQMILAPTDVSLQLDTATIEIGRPEEMDESARPSLEQSIQELLPWRKGPFKLFGTPIDSEWKSDLKWDRIAPHLGDIKGKRVLDVGCNNGYYMFRLVGAGAGEVLGIDPIEFFQRQFQLLQHFARIPQIRFEPLGIADLHRFENDFDLILHLGVIYHHPNPIQQLKSLRRALKPGGRLIVESLGIPGDAPVSLTPGERYANMKNIYFVPTLAALANWARKARFRQVTPLFSVPSSTDEQRTTDRCPDGYKSFADALHPNDPSLTKEGHPAPLRMAIAADK